MQSLGREINGEKCELHNYYPYALCQTHNIKKFIHKNLVIELYHLKVTPQITRQ